VTTLRLFEVHEILEVHEIPSEELRTVPDTPTATKILFPKVIPFSKFVTPKVLEVQVVPSVDVQKQIVSSCTCKFHENFILIINLIF